jgi:IclR family pca regulon transcriptional regulator
MRSSESPDFIEALARGLDVMAAFRGEPAPLSLSRLAESTGLARPTVRRILITLGELGYVRGDTTGYELTARTLDLGLSYLSGLDLWQFAQPHLTDLSRATGESCSIAVLEGSDAVYVARASVPKLVTLSVRIGTRFPASATSLGKVLLAFLDEDARDAALAEPSRSGVVPSRPLDRGALATELATVRQDGWVLTDQQLAPAIRSIAAPLRDGAGTVVAAINVNAHALETSVEHLREAHLPRLLKAAAAISADWARHDALPVVES